MKTSALIVAGLAVVTLSVSACASVEEPDSFANKSTSTKTAQTKSASEKSEKKEKREKKEKPEMTSGQENAIEWAEGYLDHQAFSKRGPDRSAEVRGTTPRPRRRSRPTTSMPTGRPRPWSPRRVTSSTSRSPRAVSWTS